MWLLGHGIMLYVMCVCQAVCVCQAEAEGREAGTNKRTPDARIRILLNNVRQKRQRGRLVLRTDRLPVSWSILWWLKMVAATVLFLVRHGDRFDYGAGKVAWKERCKRQHIEPSDPPLSALGHAQAREVAARLAKEEPRIQHLLVSPYLRALQTAQPLAHLTTLPMCVDHALAEAHQKPSALVAGTATRPAYLPEISESYQPILQTVVADVAGAEPGVEPRLEHLRRMLYLARELSAARFRGQTIAAFTHAARYGSAPSTAIAEQEGQPAPALAGLHASTVPNPASGAHATLSLTSCLLPPSAFSIALVAALVGSPTLAAVGKLAPCGVVKLVGDDSGWRVVEEGHENRSDCRRPSPADPSLAPSVPGPPRSHSHSRCHPPVSRVLFVSAPTPPLLTPRRLARCHAKLHSPPAVWRSAYVTSNADTTCPWGFVDSSCPISESEATWQEALRLGPTDPSALDQAVARLAISSGGQGGAESVEPVEAYYDPN